MCGTTLTEHLLNIGRRLQTSKRAWKVGRAKKPKNKIKRKKYRQDLCLWERAVKEECFHHTSKSSHQQGHRWSFGASESPAIGVQRAKQSQVLTTQHSPAWDTRLPTRWRWWGLGTKAQASATLGTELELAARRQPEGLECSALQLKESGKKPGPAREPWDQC